VRIFPGRGFIGYGVLGEGEGGTGK